MKKLSDIVAHVPVIKITGNPDVTVNKIYIDSRQVTHGSMFIAQRGNQVDGHRFIPEVIEAGASVIVCETMPSDPAVEVTYVQVSDTNLYTGIIASAYYGNPSSKLTVIGVTGTNGKTTIATLLYRLYRRLGYKTGLISTVINYIDSKSVPSTHTTPDAVTIQRLMYKMVDNGCRYCFMEVSSHAIVQERISGITFVGGIFTNLTHDHLDYHKTFDEYLKAKKRFFDILPATAFALINTDDSHGKVMVQNTEATVSTYAMHTMADFHVKVRETHFDGMLLNINNQEIWTRLIGRFNAMNALAIYATALLLGSDPERVMMELSDLHAVDGRFEYFNSPAGYTAVVDYAHTPDALVNVLNTIKGLVAGNCSIITVTGAGGNRDKTKRPVMARVCAELSNCTILTSDNPRDENPEDILRDMKEGMSSELSAKTLTITDRREAIRTACHMAKKGDVVLIAGKGHETYQEIKGVKHFFDDRAIVKEIFKENT